MYKWLMPIFLGIWQIQNVWLMLVLLCQNSCLWFLVISSALGDNLDKKQGIKIFLLITVMCLSHHSSYKEVQWLTSCYFWGSSFLLHAELILFCVSEYTILSPAWIISAGIWLVPSEVWLCSFLTVIWTSKAVHSGNNGSAVCLSPYLK
jgi:hypothetical protein